MTDRQIHELAHEFSDWHDAKLVRLGKEDKFFISFKNWLRADFVRWAKLTKLPREYWKRVFREYMND